jgi:hypothetical protein
MHFTCKFKRACVNAELAEGHPRPPFSSTSGSCLPIRCGSIHDLHPVQKTRLAGWRFFAGQRAIIAARLRPFYDEQAKQRQGQRNDLVDIQEKIPERSVQARDAAGTAAGVNGKYVDAATKIQKAAPEVAQAVLASRFPGEGIACNASRIF